MKKYTPVVLCFDGAYANYAAVTIYSAFINSKSKIKFYCLVPSSEKEKIHSINNIRKKYCLDLEILFFDENLFKQWNVVGHFSPVVYSKFIIPELVNERKVIYIDSDLLVLRPIENLYGLDLTGHSIAGVRDAYGESFSLVPRVSGDPYINTGVMLMDLDKLRGEHFYIKCSEIYEKYKNQLKMVDQCVINKCFESKKLILDDNWNVQIPSNLISDDVWMTKKNDASIIHFIFDTKPWMKWCNPTIFDFYWDFVKKLDLQDITPIEISNLNQMISLANALDLSKKFEDASKLKTQLINALLKKFEK